MFHPDPKSAKIKTMNKILYMKNEKYKNPDAHRFHPPVFTSLLNQGH